MRATSALRRAAAPAPAGRPLLPLLLLLLAALAARALGQNDPAGNFPVEIALTGAVRPSGVVAGRETAMFVATVGGALFRVDVQSGDVTMINAGGDGRALAGLCSDERGAGTLYAAGRGSGRLYAFSRDGPLQRIYQITPRSTAAAPHFIADCISTRRRLLISDAFAAAYFWLPLPDRDPERGPKVLGLPPPLNPAFALQGFEVPLGARWPAPARAPALGAFGLEWTAKWNDTAYVMHSASGRLFAFNITAPASSGAGARAVAVEGAVRAFPGALGILFDSRNELVLYVALPGNSSLAVLEFDYRDRLRAKYIRSISGPLLDGPVMAGEYGDFLYPVSGHFAHPAAARERPDYALPKISRHRMDIAGTAASADPFSTAFDGIPAPAPLRPPLPPARVYAALLTPPQKTGIVPDPPALDTAPAPRTAPTPRPSRSAAPPGVTDVFGPVSESAARRGSGGACFPGGSRVLLEGGRSVAMRDLRVGDQVEVGADADGAPRFSAVYAFSHRDPHARSLFVEAALADGRAVRLSPGHLMVLDGRLVAAAAARPGACVPPASAPAACIARVRRVYDQGLYNPQTVDGRIVVDAVPVSTYTEAVPPAAAAGALAPARFAHACGLRAPLRALSALLRHGSPLPALRAALPWAAAVQ